MRIVGMLSGGRNSWAACKRAALKYGPENVTLLFTDTKEEDPDTMEFLRLSALNVGAPLVVAADGRSLWEVFKAERMIGNTRMDVCSKKLKREVADRWLRQNRDPADALVVLGYGWGEAERFRKAEARYAAAGWRAWAPLLDRPWLSEADVKAWAAAEGLPEHSLYKEGFKHANCGGFCVKAGHAHFRHLLLARRETYLRHEREEQALREHLGKDVSVLRDRRGGRTTPLTMRAFRERIEGGGQCDLYDWGGCGCFSGDEETDNVP